MKAKKDLICRYRDFDKAVTFAGGPSCDWVGRNGANTEIVISITKSRSSSPARASTNRNVLKLLGSMSRIVEVWVQGPPGALYLCRQKARV